MALQPLIHYVSDLEARNRLPDRYEGKLVGVAYDPNYPGVRPDDPANNPTGRVYRLRLLEVCNVAVNPYGTDDSHYDIAYDIPYVLTAAPVVSTPVLTFGPLAARTVGDAAFTLAATSTNLVTPLTYVSSNPNVVSVAQVGGVWKATVVAAGSATITASQVAGNNYLSAVAVAQALTVSAAVVPTPVLTFGPLAARTVGDVAFTLAATSTNTVTPLTYASSNSSVVSVAQVGGVWKATPVTAGSATITASQAAGNNYQAAVAVAQALTVSAATVPTPVLTFGPLAARTVGDAAFALVATSTNTVTPLTYASSNQSVVSVAQVGGVWKATPVAAGSATITASQAAGNNYQAAVAVVQLLTVNAAVVPTPVITFGPLAAKTVGDAALTLAATSTNTVTPILFASSNPSVVSVAQDGGVWKATPVAAGSATITASQAAGNGYQAGSASQSLQVNPVAGSAAPVFTKTLRDSEDELTGTKLSASAGNLFKFNPKPLGDGTGRVMQLNLNGDIVAGVDFLTPYLTRLDGGAGGELFGFQLTETSTVYYGRFQDASVITLSTSYAI